MRRYLARHFLLLVAVALAGLTTALAAPESVAPRTAASGLQPDKQNVCVTGQMKWLLTAAYGGHDVCQDQYGMVAHIHRIAEIRVSDDKYELYHYDYNFKAAVVRHGGSRLLVVRNSKYAGQYDYAVGGVWKVRGALAQLFYPDTKLLTEVDFSGGPPHALQQADGGYAFLEQ